MIKFDPDILHFIGSLYGDQWEYLVCENDHEFPYTDMKCCSICGSELKVHIPNREMMVIRWRCWKSNQKWWPQKYYTMHTTPGVYTQAWRFMGKDWLVKPWKDEMTEMMDEIEKEADSPIE